MILVEIAEVIDESTKEQRIAAGMKAQRRVRDELKHHFGQEIKKIKVARVGSKMFDIEAQIHNVRQKVEVKALTSEKPYFAFFDTYATKGSHAPDLDDITFRVTNGQYRYFTDAVTNEQESGFPCDEKPGIPKSGRVPAILKNITNREVLDYIRIKLIRDLQDKGINYLAIFNRTSNTVSYYHIQEENYLNAPQFPHLRRAYVDTYGAPNHCAMRVVIRLAVSS